MRRLIPMLPFIVAFALAGCLDPSAGKKSETDNEKKSDPGEGRNPVERRIDQLVHLDNKQQGKPAGIQPVRQKRVAGKRGIVGMMHDNVYDYHQVMRLNPTFRAVPKATGQTVYSKAYFSATSRLSKATFEHNLAIWRAGNGGRWPSYAEYRKMMKKTGVFVTKLPSYAIYAYNDKTGKLIILEDPAAKQEHFNSSN